MKALRIRSHNFPLLAFFLAVVTFGIGVYLLSGGAWFGVLVCFAFSLVLGYCSWTEPLWIEFDTRLTYRNLLRGTRTHEWADVKAVDIAYSESEDEPDELVITLVSGKTLTVATSYHHQICETLSGVLKAKDQNESVYQEVQRVLEEFQSPHDPKERINTITLDL